MRRFKNEKYNNIAANIKPEFKAEAKGDYTELTIYGDIGDSWFGESVSANDVINALKDVKGEIKVNLNSPGGDAFAGIAIYNQLKNHESKVTVEVDGLAASAASLIAMAADNLIMNTGSMMMIHEASTMTFGTKADIQKTLNALEGIDKSIADIYMTRYTGDVETLNFMVEGETWLTAKEAVEQGFADRVNETKDNEEIANLQNMILNLSNEIKALKNQSELTPEPIPEPTPEPVKPVASLSKLFLNLN